MRKPEESRSEAIRGMMSELAEVAKLVAEFHDVLEQELRTSVRCGGFSGHHVDRVLAAFPDLDASLAGEVAQSLKVTHSLLKLCVDDLGTARAKSRVGN